LTALKEDTQANKPAEATEYSASPVAFDERKMKRKWAVVMNGRNFLMAMDGKQGKFGFYQTFFLEADAAHDAEMTVVAKIRKDDALRAVTRNPKNDPPTLHLDEIKELADFDGIKRMVSGKAFYSEDDERKTSNQRPNRTVAPRGRGATSG